MTSEQGLDAKEPIVGDLENEDLADTSQIAKKTDIVDATDVLQLEIGYESSVSSSEEEVPEESSEEPIAEVLVQASVTEEERPVVYNDNINNEEDFNPEKASDGAKASSLGGEEPDARTENGMLQKLIRAPRYFDPPECRWPACNEYGENDDEGKKDKTKRRRKPCYICADTSHEGKRCRKVNACFICSKKGHLAVDCPDKDVEPDCTSTLCLKCGNTGHEMFSCTNDYDPEDLKIIECYICNQVGHLCCVDKKSEGPREASCYNCGQSGHFGLECTKLNEVANDLQPLCRKCKGRGHFKRQCPKKKAKSVEKDGAATKAGKRQSRRARRGRNAKQTPLNQPNRVWWPPLVGPYFGEASREENTNLTPTGNAPKNQQNGVWWPPPTSNASMHQPNGVWWPPIVGPYYGKPGSNVWLSPAAAAARNNLSHQAGALPSRQHHQVRSQVVNSLDHFTGLPHQILEPSEQKASSTTCPPRNWNHASSDTNSHSGKLILHHESTPTSGM